MNEPRCPRCSGFLSLDPGVHKDDDRFVYCINCGWRTMLPRPPKPEREEKHETEEKQDHPKITKTREEVLARLRERYALRKAKGLCWRCARKARRGYTSCAEHATKS